MELYVNPVITDFRQEVNGDIKMLKIGSNKEDAYANIIGQASADLDNNKTKTIDVSTYTDPVEVLPTSGKDGMKKATITLSNIPSPGTSVVFYAWGVQGSSPMYTLSATPSVGDNAYYETEQRGISDSTPTEITSVGEGTITVTGDTLNRVPELDLTFSKS